MMIYGQDTGEENKEGVSGEKSALNSRISYVCIFHVADEKEKESCNCEYKYEG